MLYDWEEVEGNGERAHRPEKKFTLLTEVKSAFFYRAALSITIIKSLNHFVACGYFSTVVRIKVTLMS